MKKYFPILSWLPEYGIASLKKDIPAGVTVGIMLIPQGMAYAMIAGLPPVFGLYAALIPQLIYAILGTSRQLAVGPVAMDSLLVASGLGALSISGLDEYVSMAIFLALFMGVIQLVMGMLRMGFLVNFLSKPVISGFTSAAALIIGLSQLKHLLGIDIERSNKIHELAINAFEARGDISLFTVLIGIVGIVLILLIKKWRKSFPASLVVVVGGILFMYYSGLNTSGVAIVGNVPEGLPAFSNPSVSYDQALDLFPIALTLALIAFMEAISIAKAIEEKHSDYQVDPNQELIALGSANIVGSFFQSYPTTGGFSRTAVNSQAGAKTGMASIIAAIVVGLTLLFLTPLFYHLPKTILASIIMVAVFGLIEFKYPMKLWKNRKDEFLLLILTFLVTVSIGITQGIITGILFSLLLLVYRTAKPHIAQLARISGSDYFRNVERFDEVVERRDDLLIIRFDGQLYFGNSNYFKKELSDRMKLKGDQLSAVILNAESINYIDSTATLMLKQFIKEVKGKGVRFVVAGAIGPTRDIIFKSGIIDELGKENLFVEVVEAVDVIDGRIEKSELQNRIVNQTKQDK
jgi:SulP family sulfate permease